MITFNTYSKLAHKESGYRGPLREGEHLRRTEILLEEPLQQSLFVMNRRNKLPGQEPIPVDLLGAETNPLTNPDQTMCYETARGIFLHDAHTSYDGISLVFPTTPKPIITRNGKGYFLVGGLYKNSCKTNLYWDNTSQSQYEWTDLNDEFKADIVSLGNPLYGLSPTMERNYFFGLSEYPIISFEDDKKSIFSAGGVIAIGSSYHPNYDATGIESEIKILPSSALKLIEKWRQEAINNAV